MGSLKQPIAQERLMKARDIMTADVATVAPDAGVREIAALMAARRISGLPVVNSDGAVVGIVSESDLLHRVELGTEHKYKWWLNLLSSTDQQARDFTKSHGQKAADLMTRHVIAVTANDGLATVADVLGRNGLKRVPVLDNGKLVGVITRGDLVKAITRLPEKAGAPPPTNAAVQARIHERMRAQSWLSAAMTNVTVDDGIATVRGLVPSLEQKRAFIVLVEGTEGVRRVEDYLSVTPAGMYAS
jgi:CBS-domain-containing membrane protein